MARPFPVLLCGLLLSFIISSTVHVRAEPVIAGAEELTSEGGPDGWTNVLYINEDLPFDFSGQGQDHGILTNINFWVADSRGSQGVLTPFVAEPLVDFPETGDDFVIRAIGTTREADTHWQCGGLHSYPFHDTEQIQVQNDWVVGFLSADPLSERDDATSPIPFFGSDVDGWLTGSATPATGIPVVEMNQPILEGGSGTNIDAYGFRHYQFQVQAEPGDTQPPLPPGGRVDGACEVVEQTGNIAGQFPLANDGVPDSWTNVLYINEDAPFDFSEFGTDQGVLTDFNFTVAEGREFESVVTPFVVEPLVEDPLSGDDFVVRAIGTTREADTDWEEPGEVSFPFHDSEEFTVQDGWLVGFVSSDPEGERFDAFSPIPFVGNAGVEGWLTGTSTSGSGAPLIEIGEPILEGLSGTNVDAYGFRRYQFNITAEPGTGAAPGDFNNDGVLDAADIDLLSAAVRAAANDPAFDIDNDGLVNDTDRGVWVESLKQTYFGDADLNGLFNSGDLVSVFQRGEYEDRVPNNSNWADGDWNGDNDFTSADFVTAFQGGGYEAEPRAATAAVPEPAGLLLATLASLFLVTVRRNQ